MNVTIFGHERSPSSPALTALSRGTRHPVPPHSQISGGGGAGGGDEGGARRDKTRRDRMGAGRGGGGKEGCTGYVAA